MADETAFEKGRISNFKGLVTLTLDRVILHTTVCHSSTSTYMANFIEIKETFCRWTDVRTYVRMHGWTDGRTFETGFIRSTLSNSRPKKKAENFALQQLDCYMHNVQQVHCLSQRKNCHLLTLV